MLTLFDIKTFKLCLSIEQIMQADINEKRAEIIDVNLLILFGGMFKTYDKDEYIFKEGNRPHFYHQIVDGKIKMVNEMDDGKDFLQGFFLKGESFGEPPIFEGGEYPASAIAVQPSIVIRLSIYSFIQLLKGNFDIHWNITKLLSQRIRRIAASLKEISFHPPERRILSVLSSFKREKLNGAASFDKVKIDYTRKQIADMTGLRVETVIRIMRRLYNRGTITIIKGKVFY